MNITLALDPQQLNLVAEALGRMPFVQVAPLINEIHKQVAQQQPAVDPQSNGPDTTPRGFGPL